MIHFLDFEVFKYNWLVVIADPERGKVLKIWDDVEALAEYYNEYKTEIFCGYNIAHYDQYIFQSILCQFNPKEISEFIIVKDRPGYQFSPLLKNYPLIVYDAMRKQKGLKQLEGFMGNKIKESDVPFDIDRPLTDAEKDEVCQYCVHDVDQLIEVFLQTKKDFDAHIMLIKTFNLPLSYLCKTQAQLSAIILGCSRRTFDDEWDISLIDTLRITKYRDVIDWFMNPQNQRYVDDRGDKLEYHRIIAGVDHIFAWGGLHGARTAYHSRGQLLHVDVNSFYPAIMIEYDLLSRAVRDKSKYREIRDMRIKYKKTKNPLQAPYKIVLNSTYGICKDKYSSAYDPRQANNICINGQLLLLDLIEHLEAVQGFELIQSNTDGLIIRIPDTDEAFRQVDDVCYEWETRTRMGLGFDALEEIWQGDVNNYIFKTTDGEYEKKGAYVKDLTELDNDLPIVNKAIVNFLTQNIPIETTILGCNDLKMFQMVKKISGKYEALYHGTEKMPEKCVRVFASKNPQSPGLFKLHKARGNMAKVESTPAHCFFNNENINGLTCPPELDKSWYIAEAQKRVKKFGVI